MSRGLGSIQRLIIDEMTRSTFNSRYSLVRSVYRLEGAEPSDSQIRSLNRALKRLVAEGYIEETERVIHKGYRAWKLTKLKEFTSAAERAAWRGRRPRLVSFSNLAKSEE